MRAIAGIFLGGLCGCLSWILLCWLLGLDTQSSLAFWLFIPLYFGFGFAGFLAATN
ncbi:hypothetical protein [Hyphomicrobium sp. ghe19]|uniref:hypothetical protein n=1 Tax=Hyphomicrobium sp. ghe19 TaxID=2682968 RepID=UPI001367883A|nr:hypothetical protein HYPP_01502 [Hyphomicrobium sp. ghe19]